MSPTLKILQLFLIAIVSVGCATSTPPATGAPTETASQSDAAVSVPLPPPYQKGFMARTDVQGFYRDLVSQRNLPAEPVARLLADARYNATAVRLMAPPAPGAPRIVRDWPTYRNRFVEPIRIERGIEFMAANRDSLNKAQSIYGVPASIIAAIIGVETLYGQHMGNYRVLDSVTTLAFDYPDPNRPDRAEMFRGQLADLIDLHISGQLDARKQLGSYAGAIGIPQFMPTSIKSFAVSSDLDRQVDLEYNVNDAIMSVGNFLTRHGWVSGAPVFAPVTLPGDAASLVAGGLTPTLTWQKLQDAGAGLQPGASTASWASLPLGVIDLPVARTGKVEYRVGTPNFFALTQYNRSYFYATAVADLAQAIANQR